MEEIVEQGVTEKDRGTEKLDYRTRLAACPELVKSSLLYLRHKHKRLTGISSVTRYASKAGFLRFESINLSNLKKIEEGLRKAYLEGTEKDRLCFSDQAYPFNQRLGISKHEITARFFEWVHGAVTDYGHTLGIGASTLTIIVLVFGLASSSIWIPSVRRNVFQTEAELFCRWVNERASKL